MRPHFVGGDAVCIQSSGLGIGVENYRLVTTLTQFRSAGEACRACANQSDTVSVGCSCLEEPHAIGDDGIDCIPLQPANLDWPLSLCVQNANAFTKYRSRTDTRAALSQNIGFKNGPGRAAKIAGDDLPDKLRHVNSRRTGFDAGRIVAE